MALKSAGTTNYVHFGNNAPVAATSPYSVVVTAYVDTSSTSAQLISKRSGLASGTNLFSIALGSNEGRRPAISKNGNFYVWNSPQVSVGTWFTMVICGESTGARAFVNGVKSPDGAANNGTAKNLDVTGDWRTGAATTANLQMFTQNSGSETLIGRIARCIIYNRALSDDEAISASKGLRAPLYGRTFTADLTRTARDLTNGWSATTNGSLSVEDNPRCYGLI